MPSRSSERGVGGGRLATGGRGLAHRAQGDLATGRNFGQYEVGSFARSERMAEWKEVVRVNETGLASWGPAARSYCGAPGASNFGRIKDRPFTAEAEICVVVQPESREAISRGLRLSPAAGSAHAGVVSTRVTGRK